MVKLDVTVLGGTSSILGVTVMFFIFILFLAFLASVYAYTTDPHPK